MYVYREATPNLEREYTIGRFSPKGGKIGDLEQKSEQEKDILK